MMDVVMAIAAPLAREYGIDKAIEMAYEQLLKKLIHLIFIQVVE